VGISHNTDLHRKTHHALVQNPILHKEKISFTWTAAQGKGNRLLKSWHI